LNAALYTSEPINDTTALK